MFAIMHELCVRHYSQEHARVRQNAVFSIPEEDRVPSDLNVGFNGCMRNEIELETKGIEPDGAQGRLCSILK